MQIEITPEYLASQGLSPTFAERFWDKVFIMPYDKGCWLWTASKHNFGYGQIGRWKVNDPPIAAHRAAWILSFGPIPGEMSVCHTCDNPPCCNPHHLFLGTAKENNTDMMRKGRLVIGLRRHFEDHHNAKLDWDKVDEIRSLRSSGRTYREISTMFSVSITLVRLVTSRKAWNR